MPIVSVSLSDEIISEMDSLRGEIGIGGRSELVRLALKTLSSDRREKSGLKGQVDSVLLIIHSGAHGQSSGFSAIRHSHGGIVRTQLHSHLKNDKCLEILVLNGAAVQIKSFYGALQADKKIDYVKLIVP